LWFFIGIENGYFETAKQQLLAFLSLYSIFVITILATDNKLIEKEKIKKFLYISMYIKMTVKIVMEILVVTNLLSLNIYNFIYDDILGSISMNMNINELDLFRINTASDSFMLAILGFYLIDKTVSGKQKIIAFFCSIFFVIIVYSRIFFVQYFLLIITIIFLNIFKNITKKKIAIIFVICLFIFIIFEGVVNIATTSKSKIGMVIFSRFNSQDVYMSDYIRDVQLIYLKKDITQNPFIGKGIGAYDSIIIRNSELKYAYEKEYYSLLMQLGVIGFIIIVVHSLVLFYKSFKINKIDDIYIKILISFNFLVFIFKPIYNPGFLNSTSGAVVSVLILMSYCSINNK
jgi:hypothetical protein